MIDHDSILEAQHLACCRIQKTDVPQAESVKAAVLPLLLKHWKDSVSRAESALVQELDSFEDRTFTPNVDALDGADDERVEELVLLLLLLLRRELEAPFQPEVRKALRAAARRLLTKAASGSPEFSIGAGRGPEALIGAVSDARQVILTHLVTVDQAVRERLRVFLLSRYYRRNEVAIVGGQGRAEWLESFREALGADGTFLKVGVDAWAYRTWAIGGAEGAIASAATLLLINNPPNGPDQRTTPFCRWVHGRRVSPARAQSFVDRYRSALSSGDPEEPSRVWPLSRGSETRTPKEHAAHFARVALPPFHFLCRTVVEFG